MFILILHVWIYNPSKNVLHTHKIWLDVSPFDSKRRNWCNPMHVCNCFMNKLIILHMNGAPSSQHIQSNYCAYSMLNLYFRWTCPNRIFWVQENGNRHFMLKTCSFWLPTPIFGTLIDVKVLMYEILVSNFHNFMCPFSIFRHNMCLNHFQ